MYTALRTPLRLISPSTLRALPLRAHPRVLSTPSQSSPSPQRQRWAPGSHERRHFERVTLPYPPSALFAVVADVSSYSSFVPWCTLSRVVARLDDKRTVAELGVGFRFLSESYTSLVTAVPNESVSVDVPDSALFDYLITDWSFREAGGGGTDLCFYVEFRFRNRLYQQLSDQFFEKVVKNMVAAFEERARMVHAGQA